MTLSCHRCGGDLPGEDLRGFCPTCGAPQLRFGGETSRGEGGQASTGAPPPPRPMAIRWPIAMQCAAMVAAGTALVFAAAFAVPYLGLPSLLLLSGGSFLTVGLYRRRSPMAPMTPGIGAKLGLATGAMLTAGLAVSLAAMLVAARFRTHAMGPFDAQWDAQLSELLTRTRASSPAPAETERAMSTPEFRAGSTLAGLLLLDGFLVAISAGSGAFAGAIAVRERAKS